MNTPVVSVRGLRKVYRVTERPTGLKATVRSLFRRTFRDVVAVDGISLDIAAGEVVGFLGPNGAGKTTTLKMLSGLLHPTSGEAVVNGAIPWERPPDFLRSITLLMGNRSQLVWDIPAADSFLVLKEIYGVPETQYRRTLDELTALLELEPLLHKPVRGLSLGERMKVEFAGALLHAPRILFLDEPTLGLDVSMQARIRAFVADYNRQTGATILLTSHYMNDVVALCRRVVVIHHGTLLYDGALADLAERMAPYKRILVTLTAAASRHELAGYGEVVQRDDLRATLHVPRRDAPECAARLVRELGEDLADISVEDPPIEEVIDRVFASKRPLTASVESLA
jgi:ABC-2 type transport system ATP-binding protein